MKKLLVFVLFFCTSLSYSAPIKKALVTGRAGFLGSHMCDYLLNQSLEKTIKYFKSQIAITSQL